MSIKYKINVMDALKEKGYSSYYLRKNNILSQSTMYKLRNGIGVSWDNMERLCVMLDCQPGDIIQYEKDGQGWQMPQ